MPRSSLRLCLTLLIVGLLIPGDAFAWGRGHRLIRLWAVLHLPEWQRERIGAESLDRLCSDYTSLQDKHASGKAPELDPYCLVPGVRVSLHDVNPPEPSAKALLWFLDQIVARLETGETDEAMKFLGVLCHWNEDPGCPSAHSSPVTELQLKTLLPPPKDKERFNYLFGAGGIMDTGSYQIPQAEYRPRLLGRTREEMAMRIYQHQRLLKQHAAAHIVPIVQDMMHGDGTKADEHRAAAALDNAKHTADVIYSVLCLATGRFDESAETWDDQPLTDWLPEFHGRMIPHPYYVSPFLVDQAMDAQRQLQPLQFPGPTPGSKPQPVEHGYGMGTPFSLDFVLAPGTVYDHFTCQVGLHSTAGPNGAVEFAVVANSQELAHTKVIRSGDAPQTIDVALPKSNVLKLSLHTIAVDGSEPSHNLTVWGYPTLRRE
ncbi:hypothetical protein GC176_19905 [bacterium]|nr:hypothetical protein [bacterium]